jgi:VWFA-related protein
MRLLYVVCLPLTALSLFAQSPAPSSVSSQQSSSSRYAVPQFNATTRNVVLDAVVTDKNGDVVTGLTRDDFVIREDNTPQTIQSFDAVRGGSSAEDASPHTILLVDELNTHFADMAYTRYSVNRLLHHDGVKLDQPTALYILSNDGLHVLQSYTRNPATIDAALRAHKASLPWRVQRNFYLGLERINISMEALQQIAVANTGMPGHKNVVWISPGLPIFGAVDMTADSEKELFDSIRRLSDQLLKARISIYSVDPRGVQIKPALFGNNNFAYAAYLSGLTQTNDAAFGNLAIQTLATQTGGHVFYGRNDVDQEIATSLRDGSSYYTLAYSPSNKNFHGEFRKIRISVIQRPELKVQTRDGYYAMPAGETVSLKRQQDELVNSLLTPIPFNGIPLPLSYTQVNKSPAPHIRIRFVISSASLSWTPDATGRPSAQITVAAADKSKHGPWKASQLHVYTVFMPEGTSPSAKVETSVSFEMPYRNSNHLRFVVRDDASGHIGSSEINIDPATIS